MWGAALLLAGLLPGVSAQGGDGPTCPQAAPVPGAEALWTELSSEACTVSGPCCPAGWETAPQVGDTCYKFQDVAVSMSDAEAACASFGAQLLHIVDSTQQFFVAQRLGGNSAWLGMRGEDPQSLEWTDGRRSAYSRMWQGRTQNTGVEQRWPTTAAACVKLCSSNDVTCSTGDWDAVLCDTMLHYVCQKPSGHPRAYTTWTNTQGNSMTAGDDGWIDVVLPFQFLFFGEPFEAGDLIRVSANGYITFGAESSHNLYGSTASIPNTETPNALLAAFWTDLYPAAVEAGGGLYSLAEADRLVIEWREIPFWIPYREQGYCADAAHAEVCGRTVTFEVVLNRGDGSVQILYMECEELPDPNEHYPDHAPLAIGFENMDGTTGVDVIGGRSHTANMTGLVISIPQSCHNSLPLCAAREANATAVCVLPAGHSHGAVEGSEGDGGWVQVEPHSGISYYNASWHWGPTFALAMSFIVSFWRLYKVVTHGHIWREHWISVENDVVAVQAMLAATRAGGRGIGNNGSVVNNSLSRDEVASLVRLTSEQLREPAELYQSQSDASPTAGLSQGSTDLDSEVSATSSVLPASLVTLPNAPTSSNRDTSECDDLPGQARNFGNDTCAICMCSMLESDVEYAGTDADEVAPSLVQLSCFHVFHAECAEQWLRRSRECPVCKRDAVHGDGSADREAAARAVFAAQELVYASSDDDDDTGGGITNQDRSDAHRSIAALRGYQACNRSTLIVCLACVTGLFVTTVSEVSYVRNCKTECEAGNYPEIDLRCGFFVAISLVSFAMSTVAMAALHTPVHRRCLWDGFCGWCLYSFVVVAICTSWYDKILKAHETNHDCGSDVRSDVQLADVRCCSSNLPVCLPARLPARTQASPHFGRTVHVLTCRWVSARRRQAKLSGFCCDSGQLSLLSYSSPQHERGIFP